MSNEYLIEKVVGIRTDLDAIESHLIADVADQPIEIQIDGWSEGVWGWGGGGHVSERDWSLGHATWEGIAVKSVSKSVIGLLSPVQCSHWLISYCQNSHPGPWEGHKYLQRFINRSLFVGRRIEQLWWIHSLFDVDHHVSKINLTFL